MVMTVLGWVGAAVGLAIAGMTVWFAARAAGHSGYLWLRYESHTRRRKVACAACGGLGLEMVGEGPKPERLLSYVLQRGGIRPIPANARPCPECSGLGWWWEEVLNRACTALCCPACISGARHKAGGRTGSNTTS